MMNFRSYPALIAGFSLTILSAGLSAEISSESMAEQTLSPHQTLGNAHADNQVTNKVVDAHQTALMAKLGYFNQLSASFTQDVFDESGELLQSATGSLKLQKPNLIHWQTFEPDESEIVSDGQSLWFYQPFVEQVTVYSLQNAIANTPILLLTSSDDTLWQQYQVSTTTPDTYVIESLDANSQVKSLTVSFDNERLTGFVIKDVTGQVSRISLSQLVYDQDFVENPFQFIVPEGISVNDQR